MRIAQLGMKKIPSREGGIEIVVEELATRMATLGHSVTCYNMNTHHVSGKKFDSEKLTEFKGVRIKYVPTVDKKGLAAVSSAFFATVFSDGGQQKKAARRQPWNMRISRPG